jgi:hypothetical protein
MEVIAVAIDLFVLVALLCFVGLIVFSVQPKQRAAVLVALPLTLGAVTALYSTVIR